MLKAEEMAARVAVTANFAQATFMTQNGTTSTTVRVRMNSPDQTTYPSHIDSSQFPEKNIDKDVIPLTVRRRLDAAKRRRSAALPFDKRLVHTFSKS